MMRYLYGIMAAVSILFNAFLGGQPTQTMCCRAAIAQKRHKKWGCVFCRIVDWFDPDHCQDAFDWWFRKR